MLRVCGSRRIRVWVLVHVVSAELLTRRARFRQHIDDSISTGKRRRHHLLVEALGHIDAAVGNAVVPRRRRSQALQAALRGLGRDYPVNGHSRLVIHPYDVLAMGVLANRRDETARWRSAGIR